MQGASSHIVLFSIVALLLGACKGRDKASKAEGEPTVGTKAPLGGSTPSDSLFFSMERTPCLGFCPAYRVVLYRSGLAIWEGLGNVDRLGMHKARASEALMRELLDEAERIGFFGLEKKYDGPVTDLPSTILRLVSGERDHTVTARHRVPPALKAFAQKADSLLLPLPWVAQEDQDR